MSGLDTHGAGLNRVDSGCKVSWRNAIARLSREESRRQTRARLLESAQDIFALDRFGGASVDQIAEHAGYSKGAIYSNFESKESLFLELLRHVTTLAFQMASEEHEAVQSSTLMA